MIKMFSIFFLISILAEAKTITTNQIEMINAPAWLQDRRVQRVIEQIERQLEWDIRRIQVRWYPTVEEFERVQNLDASVLAITKNADSSIHIGPRVDSSSFDATFGHELCHVIMLQKYKDAIPKWLIEGLANYVSKRGKPDYSFLSSQPYVPVLELTHPFINKGAGANHRIKYHYMASTALMDMIASKCNIHQLLQLSVGKSLDSYLSTFCRISDIDTEFKKWISKKR